MACFLFLVLLKYPIKVLCGDVLNQFKCMKWNITALCWSAHKAVGKQNVFLNLWSQGYVKAMWKGFVVERNLDWWKISSFKFTITRHFLVLVFFWFTTQTLLNQTLFDLRKKHGCTGMVGGSPRGSFLSQTKSVFLNLQKHSTIWRLFVYTENIFSELWLCSVGRLLTMSTFYQIK